MGSGDLLNGQRNLGRGFAAGDGTPLAAIGAVPEPASMALALMGMTAIGWGQRRTGQR